MSRVHCLVPLAEVSPEDVRNMREMLREASEALDRGELRALGLAMALVRRSPENGIPEAVSRAGYCTGDHYATLTTAAAILHHRLVAD